MNHPMDPRTEAVQVRSLEFLCEQNGPPENLLKSRLADCLRKYRGVARAYLAQVRAEGKPGVILCIRNVNGADSALVKDIGEIFAGIFGAHEHLDILFLDDAQEASLGSVCQPFFRTPKG